MDCSPPDSSVHGDSPGKNTNSDTSFQFGQLLAKKLLKKRNLSNMFVRFQLGQTVGIPGSTEPTPRTWEVSPRRVQKTPPSQDLVLCAKSLQSFLTLCNPTDCSLPSSSVHWLLQARILEWVAISFSRGSNPCLLCLLHCQAGSVPLAPPEKPTRVQNFGFRATPIDDQRKARLSSPEGWKWWVGPDQKWSPTQVLRTGK